MRKPATFFIAAVAWVPAGLGAQTVAPPIPWQDVPPARLNVPDAPPTPPAGVTWQRPAPPSIPSMTAPLTPVPPAAPPQAQVAPVPTPAPVAHVAPVQSPAPPAPQAVPVRPPAPAAPVIARVAPERSVVRSEAPVGRIGPGYVMPPYWLEPQFHVRDWAAYGFAQPRRDQRWIRYYDDAVLVDRYGRVIDARHGLDWDGYDEAWEYDARGIPVYIGDGDFRPGPDDYAYVESYDGEAYATGYDDRGGYYPDEDYRHGPAYGGCPQAYGYYPPPPCAFGGYAPYGAGSGYGGVTITETIVTTHGCCAEPSVVVREYPGKERRYKPRRPRGEKG